MPIFAPAYRPTEHQETFLVREQKREAKKRKRGHREDEHETPDESSEPEAGSNTTTTYHPINRTDPYYVAGHPRDDPLPPFPFPHAAAPSPSPPRKRIDEELAGLNPPLYVRKAATDDEATSLRRRHLDNLTTILHRCMLNSDWQRASRAWALLLRTEIAGRGIDVRQNGRWGIGAEMLMRQNQARPSALTHDDVVSGDEAGTAPSIGERPTVDQLAPHISHEGFKQARDYYERLVLQYPHTPRTIHSVNALAVYPALFNVWVYEVQDRSKRARAKVTGDRPASSGTDASDVSSNASITSSYRAQTQLIRGRELDEAIPIAQRMDELLLGPPYDTCTPLLQLRGMIALWLSDLYDDAATSRESGRTDEVMTSPDSAGGSNDRLDVNRNRKEAEAEKQMAARMFRRLRAAGDSPPEATLD